MTDLTKISVPQAGLPHSSSLSLVIPDGASFDEWQGIGRELCARGKVLNWWIGDWWAFGEHRYGERAKAAAEGIFGLAAQTLANAASVARSFETSRRREVVDWAHHAEVAAIARNNPALADKLLDHAESEGWGSRRLRAEVRKVREINLPDTRSSHIYNPNPAMLAIVNAWNSAGSEVRDAFLELVTNAGGEDVEVLNYHEHLIYKALCLAADDNLPCPKNLDLEMLVGCNSGSTVPKVIQDLEDKGLIGVERFQKFRRVKIMVTDRWTARAPEQSSDNKHTPRVGAARAPVEIGGGFKVTGDCSQASEGDEP